MAHFSVSHSTRLLAIGAALCIAGCGKTHPPVAEVHGTVSYQGKPVAGGRVIFLPSGGGKQGLGTIQPDGSFSLSTFRANDGALVGNHHAMIVRVALDESTTQSRSFRRGEGQDIAIEADKVNNVDIELSSTEWNRLKD